MITKWPYENMGKVFFAKALICFLFVCLFNGGEASGRDEVPVNSASVTFPTLAKSRSCFSAN